MLDLQLIYLLLIALFTALGIQLAKEPNKTIANLLKPLNDPDKIFFIGLFNISLSIIFLYTSAYFFPTLTFAEILVALISIILAVLGLGFVFWPIRAAIKIRSLLQARLALFRNTCIILAVLGVYMLTTL